NRPLPGSLAAAAAACQTDAGLRRTPHSAAGLRLVKAQLNMFRRAEHMDTGVQHQGSLALQELLSQNMNGESLSTIMEQRVSRKRSLPSCLGSSVMPVLRILKSSTSRSRSCGDKGSDLKNILMAMDSSVSGWL
ncbi:hypothetical protein EJB05_27696, partial [Eragrostis curvula]